MQATAHLIHQHVSIERRRYLHVVVEVDEYVASAFAAVAIDAFGVGRLAGAERVPDDKSCM